MRQRMTRRKALAVLDDRARRYVGDIEFLDAVSRVEFDMYELAALERKNRKHNKKPRREENRGEATKVKA